MRKIWFLSIVSLLAIGLVGCSDSKDNDDTVSDNITTEAESESENSEIETVSVSPVPEKAEVETEVSVTEAPKNEVAQTSNDTEEEHVLEVKFESEAIAQNVIGQDAAKMIYIYLPPTYYESDTTYPVVYFLHGYGDSPKGFMRSYQPKLDEQFNGGAQEFILVALDGNSKTGGSFYVNSPASGNWEDYIVDELVTYMDENFRTIANSESRGIAGYSMGGFGALNLSLKHPDIFNATLVFCPGIFAENDLDAVLNTWNGDKGVQRSYAQAFSPDINNTTDYGNIVQATDIEDKNSIWQDWMNGFSNFDQKLENYLTLDKQLKSIKITFSETDGYDWIPRGCRNLAELLKEKKIDYSTDIFDGGHIVPGDAIEKYFIPFFGENLSY